MTAFDQRDAEKDYREKSAEDLAHIAWVDPGFLPEAKQLAAAELDRRGLAGNRDDLIERAKRELLERQELRQDADLAVHQRSAQWSDRLGIAAMVVLVWMFALIAPFQDFRTGSSPDWVTVLLVIAWIGFAVDAVRRALHGERLRLYLFLVGPLVAMLASLGCRLLL